MQAAQAVADNAAVHFHILCALTGLGDAELDRAEADIAGQDGLARLAPPGAQVAPGLTSAGPPSAPPAPRSELVSANVGFSWEEAAHQPLDSVVDAVNAWAQIPLSVAAVAGRDVDAGPVAAWISSTVPRVAASSGSLLANQVHDWLLSGPGVRPDEVERRLRGWMPPDRARSLALALWRVLAVAAVAHRRRCAGAELASALQRVKAPEAAATTATARALRTLPNTAELLRRERVMAQGPAQRGGRRRRASYRAKRTFITKRGPTQVARDMIGDMMLERATEGGAPVVGLGQVLCSTTMARHPGLAPHLQRRLAEVQGAGEDAAASVAAAAPAWQDLPPAVVQALSEQRPLGRAALRALRTAGLSRAAAADAVVHRSLRVEEEEVALRSPWEARRASLRASGRRPAAAGDAPAPRRGEEHWGGDGRSGRSRSRSRERGRRRGHRGDASPSANQTRYGESTYYGGRASSRGDRPREPSPRPRHRERSRGHHRHRSSSHRRSRSRSLSRSRSRSRHGRRRRRG